ncbi:chorismate synthase [Cryomorpha ignava]|uniref:Chorismate synthase n=1 Tax=Cryomorpha ignava TaxID=101383 RepID=A0A7K3WTD0_9FLAO|nr:chorismate synthase [Cryomorpha ignava]NEN24726.1 chorismate synthase [Cryomorpha ignava]
MAGNTFGKIFQLSTYGESHGTAIGGIIDGCPAGLNLDLEKIQKELDRRRPGQSDITTQRSESDTVTFLSGIFEGKTTGTPIAFQIPNKDQISKDYSAIKDVYRPSHADFAYDAKYGHRDYRGGGRSSARETAVRVAAGAVAKQFLALSEIKIKAFVSCIAEAELSEGIENLDLSAPENEIRCPDPIVASQMRKLIEEARDSGDSLGGIITCIIENVPAGLGEPVFDKLHANLGKAMLSINAVKGFEIGSGFAAAKMRGSEHNDSFVKSGSKTITKTNYSGGVQGGISNGMNIVFRIAFKPVASIGKSQDTVNNKGEETNIKIEGRHDPCVVPRAVPIVEAMAALVIADHSLINRSTKV